ncbi:hypothetical protein KKC08_02340 [Patescibacteria group bacterium]|nr:hypothetical protein [Patescibacteria group bacterium]MCG2702102.1 hypothetical protein [Candidatus Parcubacteria bacterium]MBU4265580.1 hypothetical protein [Patescibacteria group bacterium]MBU4390810.1 hypothetical protein [Patescibacteria group bacterium]MBU4396979.1 hypothetical protein [Patescibacteria group bacterium]
MLTAISEEIVKPMERGQVTIPVLIRKKLGITKKTWLWIRLMSDKTVLIEPVKKSVITTSFLKVLKQFVKDKKVYWRKEDDLGLKKIREKSVEDIKGMYL